VALAPTGTSALAPASASRSRLRLTRRGGAVALVGVGLGVVALVTAVVRPDSQGEQAVKRWTAAWSRGDYSAMYGELSPAARDRVSRAGLARAHRDAAATATLQDLEAAGFRRRDDVVEVDLRLRTRAFGELREVLRVPVEEERVGWRRHLVFPGLRRGVTLTRTNDIPPRAAILTRDGRTIVDGPAGARRAGLDGVGASIAGQVGPAPTERERRRRYALGFAPGTPVGVSGLERILESRVAGRPGGVLMAGSRVIASSEPRRAEPVRTTIDARVQAAAVTALAGRLGGVAALDARTAEVRALAGLAFSAPQPPGSTFKIVTATSALELGLARPRTRFPVETRAVIDGVELQNANGELCGGTFVDAFAHSCNSVFAPLGVRIGAERLVEAAERYGFNETPRLAGAKPSTLPAPEAMGGPLAVGSTAIGQGKVLATPLAMAVIAHTVASGGVRREPAVVTGGGSRARRVTSERIAASLERMMVRVVQEGTGRRASLHPVRVAGKTGTAELEDTTDGDPLGDVNEPPGWDTDAWFTAYAPIREPKLAVAVLLVRNGAGGDTAAPAARLVLRAGLARAR
jgi:penicillin-binding protein A